MRVVSLSVLLALFCPVLAGAQQPAPTRQVVGVAFGGGSARGFAHVGVIRWFEEHHVPIDVTAGTSMGGLIGGAFATGMSSHDLEQLLTETNWNEMFGASSYRYKNMRRKQDMRAYPSSLEFGLKHGLGLPAALNNGQQVDLLLTRLAVAYSGLASFQDLPTPFRCVAVDLKTAQAVVLESGSLPKALRATMSLPGIFPPVEIDGRVLVDGGAMNNVPADVVRSMGAQVVISVNVGSMEDTRSVSASLLGIVGGTVDAMMLASTRRGMAASDIVINPDLKAFNSMDWRKVGGMIDAGYQAAEALKEKLLPLALDEAAWQGYVAARNAKRKTQLPSTATMVVTGASEKDEKRIRQLIEPRLGQAIDPAAIKRDIEALSGLDAYQTFEWDIEDAGGSPRLAIRAVPKPHAPPFLMFSTNLQNTTTEDFSFQLAARYLNYDVLTQGSEVRLDVAVGSVPSIAAEFLQHIGSTPLFVAAAGGARNQRFNFVSDDVVVAQYDQAERFGQVAVGLELGNDSEVRVGMLLGRTEANVRVGNPELPSVAGKEAEAWGKWRYDTLDSVVVPSGGIRTELGLRHVLDFPDVPASFETTRTNADLTQMEATLSSFWSVRGKRDRFFVTSGLGTSFDGEPLPTDQFPLGMPFRLGAFDIGEKRGDHYLAVTGGYLRGLGRMPDFLGGPIFGGAWLENGSAWDHADEAEFYQNVGAGLIIETLVGPVMAATSFGFDGNKRFYVSVGRLFP